jgi:3-mercaptopyruvate sulfurtransferase SseA
MLADYILPGLALACFGWRVLSPILVQRRLPALLTEGAQVVDVRSPAEIVSGHAPGSVNIPLREIGERAKELDRNRPVIDRMLNAGSWRSLP